MKKHIYLLFVIVLIIACKRSPETYIAVTVSNPYRIGTRAGSPDLFDAPCCDMMQAYYCKSDSISKADIKPLYLKKGYKMLNGKESQNALPLFYFKRKPDDFGAYCYTANKMYFEVF